MSRPYYWQAVRPSGEDLRSFLEDVDILDPALIAPTRLPLAVVSALCVLLFYRLVRRLFDEKVAAVATLLVALSPFHIALSRVLHQDALTANFMVLSLLCMVGYWLQGWKRRWLVVSAIFAGIGFLAKAVSWFMMPCAAMIGLLSLYYHWRRGEWRGWRSVGQMVGEGVAWGVVAWLTFAALFPATWVIPGEVVRSMIDMSFGDGRRRERRGPISPGPHRARPRPAALSRRLAAAGVAAGSRRAAGPAAGRLALAPLAAPASPAAWLRQKIDAQPAVLALALFVATFLVFETLSSKKMVRFFLPAFPVIDIFVALGLLWLADPAGSPDTPRSYPTLGAARPGRPGPAGTGLAGGRQLPLLLHLLQPPDRRRPRRGAGNGRGLGRGAERGGSLPQPAARQRVTASHLGLLPDLQPLLRG